MPAAPSEYNELYDSYVGEELTVVGILRPKEDAATSYLSPGIAYTTALTAFVLEDAKDSGIAIAQRNADQNLLLGTPFSDEEAKDDLLIMLGAQTIPTGVDIYPKDFNAKDDIKEYFDSLYN